MTGKPGVMIYFDLLPVLDGLTVTDKGVLLEAILQYSRIGIVSKLTKRTALIWPMIQQRLDSDTRRYYETVRKREYGAYVRWAKRNGEPVMPYASWVESRGEYIESLTYYPNKADELRAKFPPKNRDDAF